MAVKTPTKKTYKASNRAKISPKEQQELAKKHEEDSKHLAQTANAILARRKYSKELHEEIIENIKLGMKPENACLAAGVSSTTYFRWLQVGKEQLEVIEKDMEEGKEINPEDFPFQLVLAYDMMRAKWEWAKGHHAAITDLSRNDPLLRFKILETFAKENYGRDQQTPSVNINTEGNANITLVTVDELSKEQWEANQKKVANGSS